MIFFKKGVNIYNLALFSFVGKDKNAKANHKKGLRHIYTTLCNTPKTLIYHSLLKVSPSLTITTEPKRSVRQ